MQNSAVVSLFLGIQLQFDRGVFLRFPACLRKFFVRVTAVNHPEILLEKSVVCTFEHPTELRLGQDGYEEWIVEIFQGNGNCLVRHVQNLVNQPVCFDFRSGSLSDGREILPKLQDFTNLRHCRLSVLASEEVIQCFASKMEKIRFVEESQYHPEEFYAIYQWNGTGPEKDRGTDAVALRAKMDSFLSLNLFSDELLRRYNRYDIFFSVLVPVYNTVQSLEKCLKSIMEQEYRNLEILVCDDGSTDGSLQLLEDLALTDSRIRILRHPKNQGRARTRKDLALAATAPYLIWVDSDDELLPGACASANQAIKQKDCDITVFPCVLHFPEGRDLRVKLPPMEASDERVFKEFLKPSDMFLGSLWGKVIRASLFRENMPEGYEDLPVDDAFFVTPLYAKAKTLRFMGKSTHMYLYNAGVGSWSKVLLSMRPEDMELWCKTRDALIRFYVPFFEKHGESEKEIIEFLRTHLEFVQCLMLLKQESVSVQLQFKEILLRWFCKDPESLLNDGAVKLPRFALELRKGFDTLGV